jgi:hypothetical protein
VRKDEKMDEDYGIEHRSSQPVDAGSYALSSSVRLNGPSGFRWG